MEAEAEGESVTIYVLIGIVQAVTVGMVVWGTGWIMWHRLSRWRQSRGQRSPESR